MDETVHIVIPYFQGGRFIHRCVESMVKQTVPVQVWIIDNDHNRLDDSLNTVHVKILRTRPQIGYGRAANVGIYHALANGAHKMVVTNQDVKFEPNTIENLTHDISDTINIHLPVLLEYDSQRISDYFAKRVLESSGLDLSGSGGESNTMVATEKGYGACLAFSRKLVEDIGLFDPVFRMYGEDEDLFHRVRKAGGDVKVCTGSKVHHYHSDITLTGKAKERIDLYKLKGALLKNIKHDRGTLFQFMKVWGYSVTQAMMNGRPGLALSYMTGPVANLLTPAAAAYLFDSYVKKRILKQIDNDRLD